MWLAQALTPKSILDILIPESLLSWGTILYLIIFLDIVVLFMQGKHGNLQITVFLAISIMSAFISMLGANVFAKHYASSMLGNGFFHDALTFDHFNFANFMIGVLIFIMVLVVAGLTKAGKSRLPAFLAALFGMLFVFGHWFSLHPTV